MVMLGSGNQWLKAANVKEGDVVKFETEGGWEASRFLQPDTFKDGTPNPNAGKPQNQFVIDVTIGDEQMKMALNSTNREVLVEAFGRDTMGWIGNAARITFNRVKGKNGLENRIVLKPISPVTSPDQIEL